VGNKIQEEEACEKLLKKTPAGKYPVFKPARSPVFQIGARIERLTKGEMTFSPFDSWRPIHLWVVSQKPTILTKLQALTPLPVHSEFPQAQFIPIDFAGLDIPSSRLAEVIRNRAPNAKEKYS